MNKTDKESCKATEGKMKRNWRFVFDENRLRSELKANQYGNFDGTGRISPAVVIIAGKWSRRCEKSGIRYLRVLQGFNKVKGSYYPVIHGLAISILDEHLVIDKSKPRLDNSEKYRHKSIGEALYVINKAAKRRRDAAPSAYECGCFGFASKHKREKEEYYEVKDKVLRKAIDCGLASYAGLHSVVGYKHSKIRVYHDDECCCDYCYSFDRGQRDEPGWDIEYDEGEVIHYFDCYEIDGYRFHSPTNKPEGDVEVKDLGEWTSEAKEYDGSFPIKHAIGRLEEFMKIPSN